MGCIASCFASCVGGCVGQACGKCCSCGEAASNTRLPYLIIMFLGTALAVVLRYWGHPLFIHNKFIHYDICESQCMGFEAAYRISFVLFVFFFLHALPLACRGGTKVHTSFWLSKILLMIVLLVASFFIPNSFFDVYANIARFIAGVFLLLQIIIIIDFAYSWNESWMADDREWKYRILFCCLLLVGGSITLCVFSFKWFTHSNDGNDCTRNEFFIGWTIAITIVFTLISITERVEHGALLPSCVVMLHCFYVLYTALSSDPSSCNRIHSESPAQVVIGILLASFSISYAGWNLSNSKSLFSEGEDAESNDAVVPLKGSSDAESQQPVSDASPKQLQESEHESEDQAQTRKRNMKFHLVMAAASMYLAMLITNWGDSHGSSTSYDSGDTSTWIRIASQWVTMLLYIWSLVAPLACPDRFARD